MKSTVLAPACVVLLGTVPQLSAQTVSIWSGGTGDWLDPAKWSPSGVPNAPAADVLVDNSPGTASVVTFGRNDNFGTSINVGRLSISAGDTVQFGSANSGLNFDNSAFAGAGSLSLNGTLKLPYSSGTLSGTKTITGTGLLLLGGAGQRPEITGNTSNAATIRGSALFGRANASNPQMTNSGLIEANISGQDIDFHGQGGANRSINTGTLKASGGGKMQLGQGEWLNTGGQLVSDGAGSQIAFYRGGLLENGTVSSVNGGILQVGGNFNGSNGGYTFRNVTLSGPSILADTLSVAGTLTNNGVMTIPGGGRLYHSNSAGATIAGTGDIVLDAPQDDFPELIDQGDISVPSVPWNFQNVKVRGRGNVGYRQSGGAIDNVAITNQGTFQADVDGETLLIDVSSFDNRSGGLLRATGSNTNPLGGVLRLAVNGPLKNTGGTIEALNKGRVEAAFARIEGGLVRNNGGFIDLNGMTLVNPGSGMRLEGEHTIGHPTVLNEARMVGEIENTGLLRIESGAQIARLWTGEYVGATQTFTPLTLRGGGEIRLGDPANTARPGEIWDGLDGPFAVRTVTNVDNLIHGFGRIGNRMYDTWMLLQNQKTVQADVTGQTLSIGLHSATNDDGVFRATNGGRMELHARGGFNNTDGKIEALANSTVAIYSTEITGGVVSSAVNGTIAFPDGNTGRGGLVITNAGTTTFGANGGTREFQGVNNGGSTLINSGTIRKVGGGDYSVRTSLNSTGSIVVESGVLRNLGGGTVDSSTFNIAAGTDLTFEGTAPYTFSGVTQSTGAGMLSIVDTVYLEDAETEFSARNFRFYHGTLSGPGLLSHSGRLEFYAGTNNAVSGARLLTKAGGTGSIDVPYYWPVQFSNGATWENQGTIAFSDAGWRPAITGTAGTAIINRANGVIRNDDSESGTLDITTQNEGRFEVTRGRMFLDKSSAWSGGTASLAAGTELLMRGGTMSMTGTANSTAGEGWLHFVATGSLSLPANTRLAAEHVGFWDTTGMSGPGELRVSKAVEWHPASNTTHTIDATQVNLLEGSANKIEAYATLRLQNGAAIRNAGTLDFRNAVVTDLSSGGILENSGTITVTSSGNNPYFGGDGTGLFRTTSGSLTRFFPSNGDQYTVNVPFDFAGEFRADSGMKATFERGGLLNESAKLSPNHPNSSITLTGSDKIYRVRGQANEFPGTGYVNLNNTTLQFEPSTISGHVSSIAAGARVAFHGNNTVKGAGTLSSTGLVFQNGDQTVDGATLQTTGGDVSVWNATNRRVQFKNGAEFKNTGRFVIQTRAGTDGNPAFYGLAGTRFHNTSTGQLVNDTGTTTQFDIDFQNDGELEVRAGKFEFLRSFVGTGGIAVSGGGKIELPLSSVALSQLPASLRSTGAGSELTATFPSGDIAINLTADGGKMVAAGGGNLVAAGGGNILSHNGGVMVAAGGGNMVAAGGGNLVAAGGGNIRVENGGGLVAAGGGNILSHNGGVMVAAGGGNILSHNGGVLVAAGGGNIRVEGGGGLVAAGGGNMRVEGIGSGLVAAGGGNILSHNGGTMVAAGGGNLVAAGGGNLVAAGGGNLVAAGGGNLVAAGGGNLVAAGGGNLVAAGGGNLVAAGGGNLVAAGGGNFLGMGGTTDGGVGARFARDTSVGMIVVELDGRLSGTGNCEGGGRVEAGGFIAPGDDLGASIGVLTWTGALEIQSGGNLEVQLGGPTAGSQHDRLNLSGALALNGQLVVSFVNGYGSTVTPADVFDVAVSDVSVTSALDGARVPALGSYGTLLVSVVNNGKTLRLSNFQANPVNYANWALKYGLTGTAAEWNHDPFSSGLNNLLKYALGLDPTKPGGKGPYVGIHQDGPGNRYLSISFTKPVDAEIPTDLVYTVERSSALAPLDWSSSTEHVVPAGPPVPGPGNLQTFTFRSTHPMGSGTREFLRLRVTKN